MAAEDGKQFTPGPWIHSYHGFQVLTVDREISICELKGNKPRDEQVANAALIASAPTMHARIVELERELAQLCTVPTDEKIEPMWGDDEIEREAGEWRAKCKDDAEAWRQVAYLLRDNYEANMRQMIPRPMARSQETT